MFNFAMLVLAFVVAFAIVEVLKMAFGFQIALQQLRTGYRLSQSRQGKEVQIKIVENAIKEMQVQMDTAAHEAMIRMECGDYDLNSL